MPSISPNPHAIAVPQKLEVPDRESGGIQADLQAEIRIQASGMPETGPDLICSV
jgi:hypothetical protein